MDRFAFSAMYVFVFVYDLVKFMQIQIITRNLAKILQMICQSGSLAVKRQAIRNKSIQYSFSLYGVKIVVSQIIFSIFPNLNKYFAEFWSNHNRNYATSQRCKSSNEKKNQKNKYYIRILIIVFVN